MMNCTIITGRLTADPEIRYTIDEKPVASFRIAVKGLKGNDYINCKTYGNLARICKDYLKKGRLIAVEGNMRIAEREVSVNNLQMLDFKGGN